MFRFFKYILIFIASYKLIKMIWAQLQPQEEKLEPKPPRQNVYQQNHYHQYPNQTPQQPPAASKFNDAEFIDYEEVK